MEIRRFKNKDQEQVKKLITNILAEEFSIDQKAYPPLDLDSISKTYGGEREAFFVADDQGKIVGTIGVKEESKNAAMIRRLFVKPSCRGKGYGHLLFDRALEFCIEKGYREVLFHVSNTMRAAIDLCKKKGFVEGQKLDLGGVNITRFSLIL